MFEASTRVELFEYFRVPYAIAEDSTPLRVRLNGVTRSVHWLRAARSRTLYWPAWDHYEATKPAFWKLEGVPFFARLAPEAMSPRIEGTIGGSWRRTHSIEGVEGVSAIWQDDEGNVLLPFDPSDAMSAFWSELYRSHDERGLARNVKSLAMATYYAVRPVLPRPAQISMRRLFSLLQRRQTFPRWPIEPALHDLYALLFRLISDLAGELIPSISLWPSNRRWALVLTHDVETSVGYHNLNLLRDIELRTGHRSSWNFVPKRYQVDDVTVRKLLEEGFEVGVHGLMHDGRDLASERIIKERLPQMRNYAERWQASGFRSPATLREWDLMPMLGFDYDSSYPDTDPFEPLSGGCCTWLPYFNRDLIELPITLVQDHTLFVILGYRSERVWIEKTEYLKSRQGMALLITHPDYMLDSASLAAYERFLDAFAKDSHVWRALPREVSAWWRRRAASTIATDGVPRVVGPTAEEATISMLGAP